MHTTVAPSTLLWGLEGIASEKMPINNPDGDISLASSLVLPEIESAECKQVAHSRTTDLIALQDDPAANNNTA